MTRYLHISPDAEFETRIRDAFGGALNGELRRCDSPIAASLDLADEDTGLEVIVLGPGLPVRDALDLAARLDADCPEVGIIAVAERSADVLADMLRVGIRDVVAPDAEETEIRRSMEWAGSVAASRRGRLSGAPAQEDLESRIVAVVSPKGGAGKTTVATNLAVTLAQADPGSTVIVDLDLQFGDVDSALQLSPEHRIGEAVGALTTGDAVALKVYLTGHPSGLFTLCAPESPADGERVSAEQTAELLQMLTKEFRTVIVDTSAGASEHTLAALEVATDVLLVCNSDVPSVRNLRKELAILEQLGIGGFRRHIVLNHAGARGGIAAVDVEEAIGLPVTMALPTSPDVLACINEGTPIATVKPRSAYARQIATFATRFQPAAAPRRRWFHRSTR